MKRVLIVCFFLVLFVATVSAQPSGGSDAHVLYVDSSAYPQVTAYLNLVDNERFAPISNLTPDSFSVEMVGGQSLTVESVAPSSRPVHVVVVIDVTGSVSISELANEAQAVRVLAERLDANDQLGLIEMNDQNAQMLAPMQSDTSTALAALDTLSPLPNATGNVYWDGVNAALTLVSSSSADARRVVIIITDVGSGDGAGTKTQENALSAAAAQNIEIYGMYFEHEGDGIPENAPALPNELTVLSEATGGFTLGIAADLIGDDYADDSALPVMMGNITGIITNETQLTVSSPLPADGSLKEMTIQVTYLGNPLSPIRAEFSAGETPISITFPSLTDQQGVSLPQDVAVNVSSSAGSIESMAAFAVTEAGQRIPLGEVDPANPVVTLGDNVPSGLFRLLIEATDSEGNHTESGIFLNSVEGLSVRLIDVPSVVKRGEPFTVTARIGLASTIQSAALRVDGVDRQLRTQGPFDLITFDWTPEEEGEFEIEVLVRDTAGTTASQKKQVEVRNEVSAGSDGQDNLGKILVFSGAFLIGLLVVFGVGSLFLLRRRTRPLTVPPMTTRRTPPPAYNPPNSTPIGDSPATPAESMTGMASAVASMLEEEDDILEVVPPPVISTQAPPPPARPPSGIPVAQLHGANGELWTLYEGENTLGRHGTNHVVIHDESVSRYHAKIDIAKGKCFFFDWQASHPSEMNGKLLESNKRYELKNGDTLRLGSSLLRFMKL